MESPTAADIASASSRERIAPEGDALRAWLRLTNCQFTARLTTTLLNRFDNDPLALFAASDSDLDSVPGFLPRHLVRLRDDTLLATDRQLAWIERQGVYLILHTHPVYPRLLREIIDPPPVLFVRGTLAESDRFGVGIVGSRRATPYGKAVAERMARELTGHGLTVVSGGAVGIDTAAHRGAVAGGGRTLAVLGCGLDVDYPRENRALFEQIVGGGALISEYPLGAQPESWRFPMRNRLISGMAMGVLVVEAPRQSGALNTARHVAEQNRPLLVVPGNIDRPSSEGSNELLKDGAVPILSSEDILNALGMTVLPKRTDLQHRLELDPLPGEESDEAATASAKRHAASRGAEIRRQSQEKSGAALLKSLPEAQQRLLECLSLTPKHIDAAAKEAGLTAVQAGTELTMLEINGLVSRLPGNSYIRTL